VRLVAPTLLAAALAAAAGAAARGEHAPLLRCAAPRVSTAYAVRIARVLGQGRDLWGERLLHAEDGPTLAAASRLLPPLFYAAGRGGLRVTSSGAHYVPFTVPTSVADERGFGLHVADGSEIIVRRVGGPNLIVGVGRGGHERYGSCAGRRTMPRLADGYLPILQVAYTDGAGVRYREESFVGRAAWGGGAAGDARLVSFVRVDADATDAHAGALVRLRTSRGGTVGLAVRPGTTAALVAAFAHHGARLRPIGPASYAAARAAVAAYWQQELASMPVFEVPEPRVMDALRALEIQDLELTWRYSAGNQYEELSYAEGLDVAQVMAEYGQDDVARQILRFTLRKLPERFTNWHAGERLVAGAALYRLGRDAGYVEAETPGLRVAVGRLERSLARDPNGLLERERYSSDIADRIYSLQGQTLVWQGLRAMAPVWAETGHPALARRSLKLAARLEAGLRRAVRASARRLRDGSLFVPVALLDGEAPFAHLTDSRPGSYWNLVAPYALGSGFFAPGSADARGLLRYVLRHGSRLLGLVRSAAFRLAGTQPGFSGTDQVYGLGVSRFLADNDRADLLVLSLYGTLGAAVAPGTYVAGEAASVTPRRGERYRTMYLPPNNTVPATLLETLRLTLLHETVGADGVPQGLELAFATPRAWLADGKSIAVHGAPTSFGPLSYSLVRRGGRVDAVVVPPSSPSPARLRLRVRLPRGEHVWRAELGGRALAVGRADTIDLPTGRGELRVALSVGGTEQLASVSGG
jgi:hypothetical protein